MEKDIASRLTEWIERYGGLKTIQPKQFRFGVGRSTEDVIARVVDLIKQSEAKYCLFVYSAKLGKKEDPGRLILPT